MKAVLAGAGGLTGSFLLQELLDDDLFSQVIILVRNSLKIEHPKLKEIRFNFNEPKHIAELQGVDVMFCTLGTTIKKAGSQDAFFQVDYTYPISLAKLCEEYNIPAFHIVTAMGANSKSTIFYNRVKGQVEDTLKKCNISSIVIYQPSMLLGPRQELRIGESIGQKIMLGLSFLFLGPLKKYKAISASCVASAMKKMAINPKPGVYILESDQIQSLCYT